MNRKVLVAKAMATKYCQQGLVFLPCMRMCEAGLSNRFCPLACQSVCQSVIKILG